MMRGFDSIESMNSEDVLVKRKRGSKKFVVAASIIGGLFFIVGILIGYFGHKADSGISTTEPQEEKLSPNNYIIQKVNADFLQSQLKDYASQPHLAGTKGSSAVAESIKSQWVDSGIDDVHITSYNVLLSYPNQSNPNTVEIVDTASGQTVFISSPFETPLSPEENQTVAQPYNAFSPSGTVLGSIVYVNYGRLEDLEFLRKNLSIDLNGKVFIARYGKILQQNMVLNAERYNASAVIIYWDPADANDGQREGEGTYPFTKFLPNTGVQRGTIAGSGDPESPLYPSTDYAPVMNAKKLPNIPCQPVSYGDAFQIFTNMSGPVAPDSWQGKLPITYKIGPGFENALLNVRVTVNNVLQRKPIHNVIGILKGSVEAERYVILGSHHDSWVFGAADPGSSTVSLSQLVSLFGDLLRSGYRPRRTLVFCSWDAEEFGLIGSTEWVEEKLKILSHRAVAYLNVDVAVLGHYTLSAVTSPLLQDALYQAAKKIPSPEDGFESLYQLWLSRPNDDKWSKEEPRVSYSFDDNRDYKPFYSRAGISCLDLSFRPNSTEYSGETFPVYHTLYETYSEYIEFQDPGLQHTVSLTQLWGVLANDLANAPLLPMSVTRFSSALSSFIDNLLREYQVHWETSHVNIDALKSAVKNFSQAASDFQERLDAEHDLALNSYQLSMYNDKMIQLERMFTNSEGLPNRPQHKNILFGSSPPGSLKDAFFPGILDAMALIQQGKDHWDGLKQQIYIATVFIQSAASSLDSVGL